MESGFVTKIKTSKTGIVNTIPALEFLHHYILFNLTWFSFSIPIFPHYS